MVAMPGKTTQSTTRTRSSRATKPASSASVDSLADRLTSGLNISDVKGKQKASDLSEEYIRLESMRSVNLASQTLSKLVQSGWTYSGTQSSAAANARTAAAAATKHLAQLRQTSPGILEVERVAMSVLGKLVGLQMYEEALDAIQAAYPSICALLGVSPCIRRSSQPFYLLSMSLPNPSGSVNNDLLTVTAMYLAYALNTLTHICFTHSKNQKTGLFELSALSRALARENPSLLLWLPHCSSLPPKQLDSILTRTYTILIKSCASSNSSHEDIFILRMYAMECLAYSSMGTVASNTFWGQVVKFVVVFIKSKSVAEEKALQAALAAFAAVIAHVEKQNDKNEFLRGKGFVEFCEYWLILAKKSGDVDLVNRVAGLIQGLSIAPSSPNQGRTTDGELAQSAQGSVEHPSRASSEKSDRDALEAARVCATLAQVTTTIEQRASDTTKRVLDAMALFKDSECLLGLLQGDHGQDTAEMRISNKVDRAVERMRRAVIKVIDVPPESQVDASNLLHLLQSVSHIQQHQCRFPQADANTYTRALDTLFILARTQLVVSDPRTYVPAYDTLRKAADLIEPRTFDLSLDIPNYLRCISGAFHNIAGTLYQASRHGSAIGFLKHACTLGTQALTLRKERLGSVVEGESTRIEEGWKQLEEQLCRRWELLGTCFLKIGDRKPALDAFHQYILTFPYSNSELLQRVTRMNLLGLFDSSNTAKQLASIVDRATHLSACELLMEPSAVSLVSLQVAGLGVTGAILERQIASLEMSQWKDGVPAIIAHLFMDLLKIYTSDLPVRRARVLVKCMDFMYHNETNVTAAIGNAEGLGSEVEALLVGEHLKQDAELAGYCVQYRAAAHLWLVLHAHRRQDAQQSSVLVKHLEEACVLLKTALRGASEHQTSKKSSPKRTLNSKVQKSPPNPPTKRSTRKPPAVPNVDSKSKRKALQNVSLNVETLLPQTETKKIDIVFDDFDKFFGLLQLATRISGLLTSGLSKVHLLDVSRKLCKQYMGLQSDGYIISSIDLACEYTGLGKVGRAAFIFDHVLNVVRGGKASDEASSLFFLRFAEYLAINEDIEKSCSAYSEALALSERSQAEDKSLPTVQRVQMRVERLQRAALVSHVFALIQYAKEDVATAIDGTLRSLRLWNRAMDAISRMKPASFIPPPAPTAAVDDNPFDMSNLKSTLPADSASEHSKEILPPKKTFPQRISMNGIEWQISEGLLKTLFSLSQLYFNRGSAREAEFFAQQAQDLAESVNAPVIASRALTKRGEIYLYQGQFEVSMECLTKAATLVENRRGIEIVNVQRLCGSYKERMTHYADAQKLYGESLNMIEELDKAFKQFDAVVFGGESHKSSIDHGDCNDIVLPDVLATVLRQHIWLLRERDVQHYAVFLDQLFDLPHSSRSKAEENSLMAKLSLHTVYNRFRADMFLSSLTESTISLPMGMSSKAEIAQSPSPDIVAALEAAKKFFWANFTAIAHRGNVADVRDAVVSLALVEAFRTSLGGSWSDGSHLAANLLASSVAITLRREMLETIQLKFPQEQGDDIQWPLIGPEGSLVLRPRAKNHQGSTFGSPSQSDDDDELDEGELSLKNFWASVQTRCQVQALDITHPSTQLTGLPSNWMVVHMNITEDKSTLLISRQNCGISSSTPLVFCIPLKGRRDGGDGTDEDEHMTFDDAITEFKDIVRLSDEGTKAAVRIKPDDRDARASWWKERSKLDTRLRELLENVEFCWLGAFKTILSPHSNLTPELVSDLRSQFEKVFHQSLCGQDNQSKQRTGLHKKAPSQNQALAPSQVTFDDALLECFSTLSPKCRDEELEDLIYFVLDLYQFHGVPVATAEIDVVQVAIDLRAVLEEHVQKLSHQRIQKTEDEHLFLVLDKNLQGLPWESIPILRGRSVSRIPSIDFLHDRVHFAQWKRETLGSKDGNLKGAVVDPHKGYYILNPSGDLDKTEGRFKDWTKDMEEAGWEGVTGRAPSEQQFLNALRDHDLVVYFGHGGGEQYLRSHKLRSLPTCAATMLWGCSSGALREMGDFERIGTPNSYMLAGCPCLVANLWDVTDRDIDKFSQAVFDKLCLSATGIKLWGRQDEQTSVVEAVGQSRDSCKLKYLTGAAPVVYGIPFYI